MNNTPLYYSDEIEYSIEHYNIRLIEVTFGEDDIEVFWRPDRVGSINDEFVSERGEWWNIEQLASQMSEYQATWRALGPVNQISPIVLKWSNDLSDIPLYDYAIVTLFEDWMIWIVDAELGMYHNGNYWGLRPLTEVLQPGAPVKVHYHGKEQ